MPNKLRKKTASGQDDEKESVHKSYSKFMVIFVYYRQQLQLQQPFLGPLFAWITFVVIISAVSWTWFGYLFVNLPVNSSIQWIVQVFTEDFCLKLRVKVKVFRMKSLIFVRREEEDEEKNSAKKKGKKVN